MLLFQKRFHPGLLDGSITLTFRRWERPHVKPGGRYRCHPIGVLEVDRVSQVRLGDISAADAKRSGFESKAELLEYIQSGPGGPADADTSLFKVELHHGGDGDRVELALQAELDAAAVEEIREKLARMDARSPWTMETLALIERQPQIAASRLAKQVGRETAPFKVDVRKLKKLGLTQSFEVGYELSPRGRAYLERVRGAARKRSRPKAAVKRSRARAAGKPGD